jgi:nucleoid DNA-binding protein
MDKPQSLSMREYLVRKLAPKLLLSEKVIDAVVVHQFTEANSAMLTNNSIEISGFGKFVFNTKKAKKKVERLNQKLDFFSNLLVDEGLSETKRQHVNTTLSTTNDSLNSIKSKIND